MDPTGQHVYVGDERNPFVGRTTARIYEFDVSGLHKVRRFRLAGNDLCCDLAVTPDGHLFAQVGPPNSTQVLLQEYSSTGGFENQFISPQGGLAIGPTGDIFAGSRTKRRIDRLSRSGKLLETLGGGHFTGFPVVGAVDRAGDVYAFDEAKNDVSTILKFAPVVPQTTITAHPPSTLQIPTATFRFKSSIPGAKLECRLRKAGASPPAFKPCSSPTTYNSQPNGSYTFEARSTSPAGPVDPTPARFKFKVELLYPQTMITSTPASTIGVTSATFAFKSSSAGATFACRLALVGSPPPAFKTCPSPVTYVQLSDGTWKFEVQSTSTHGVTDPTPATYQFTIDTTPPIVAAPAAPTIPVGGQLQLDGTLGVQESWSASDTFSPSSELLYTVEQRAGPTPASLGSFAAIPTLTDMQGTTAAIVPIAPGGPYHQLRVRAENQLGVAAESPAGDPFRLDVIDDSAAPIVYSTGWAQTSDTAAYGGELTTTSTAGSTATMTFSGRSIAVIAPLGPAYGSIRDLPRPRRQHRRLHHPDASFDYRARARHRLRQRSSRRRVAHHPGHQPKRFADRARRLRRARLKHTDYDVTGFWQRSANTGRAPSCSTVSKPQRPSCGYPSSPTGLTTRLRSACRRSCSINIGRCPQHSHDWCIVLASHCRR